MKNNKYFNSYSTMGLTETENKFTKLSPHWITDFADAESSFIVRISRDKNRKTGWRVSPMFIFELDNRDILLLRRVQEFFGVGVVFSISQHSRGLLLMSNIISYLNCGTIEKPKERLEVRFVVYKFYDIFVKILPFLNKYPLQSFKNSDFLGFVKVANLMKDKSHLTLEGLNKIRLLKVGMNKARVH